MHYLHLYRDIRQGTGKNNLINFVHSCLYDLCPLLHLGFHMCPKSAKGESNKNRGTQKRWRTNIQILPQKADKPPRKCGQQIFVGRRRMRTWKKYQPTKIMEKNQKHTYIWMALGNWQGPLWRRSVWGKRCLRAFKSDHPAMRYHSLSASKASTMNIKGKQELGHTDKSTKIALKTQELGD